MGGELHHRGQSRSQVVRQVSAQRGCGALPDSNLENGPRACAGRFRFRMRKPANGPVTFEFPGTLSIGPASPTASFSGRIATSPARCGIQLK